MFKNNNDNICSIQISSAKSAFAAELCSTFFNNNDNSGEFGIAAYDASLNSTAFELTNFIAYPNPVKDVLNLEYTANMSSVAVYNMIGQQVINQQVNATAAKINMTELNSGTYVVQVVIDGTTQVLKVVKE